MKIRINWTRFALVFCICQIALFASGCTAAWIGAVDGLIPALSAAASAIFAFVASLEGKTVPASVNTAIQKVGADVQTQLTNLQTLLSAAASNTTAGIPAQISAVLNTIIQDLQSILTGFSITDPATTSKLTQFVELAVVAAQAVLGLLPLLASKLASTASPAMLEHADKVAASTLNHAKQTLDETYQVIISEHTESVDVNAALDALPRSL